MDTEELDSYVLPMSKLFNISIASAKIRNVGMSVHGIVFKIVEIVDYDNEHFYAVLQRDKVVVSTTERRIADLVFVNFTGMSTS